MLNRKMLFSAVIKEPRSHWGGGESCCPCPPPPAAGGKGQSPAFPHACLWSCSLEHSGSFFSCFTCETPPALSASSPGQWAGTSRQQGAGSPVLAEQRPSGDGSCALRRQHLLGLRSGGPAASADARGQPPGTGEVRPRCAGVTRIFKGNKKKDQTASHGLPGSGRGSSPPSRRTLALRTSRPKLRLQEKSIHHEKKYKWMLILSLAVSCAK